MGCFGVLRWHETARAKEKQGEKDKGIGNKKKPKTQKNTTILWRFLLAIFDYETVFFEIFAIFVPTNRGYNQRYVM